MRRVLLPLTVLAVAAVGACSSAADAVGVTSTNNACTAEKTSFAPGKVTFKVTNKGSQETELYVYAPGDKIVGEVEDVGPGTSRNLSVKLKEGSYELACKPGQKGNGIRRPITVKGS